MRVKFGEVAIIIFLALSVLGAGVVAPTKSEVEAMYTAAAEELNAGHYREAIAKLDALEARQPDVAAAYNLRGVILMRLRDFRKAETALRKARELDPDFAEARFNLAEVAFLSKQWAEAQRRFTDLLAEPNERWKGATGDLLQFKVLLTSLLQGKEKETGSMLEKLQAATKSPALYYAKAALALRRKERKAADSWMKTASQEFSPELNKLFTESFYEVGWLDKPKGAAPVALELISPNERVQRSRKDLTRAEEAYRRGDFAEASRLLDDLEKTTPGQAVAFNLRGEVLLAQGKIKEAGEALQSALEVDPQLVVARYHLARVAIARKEYDQARKDLEALLAAASGGKDQMEQLIRYQIFLTLLAEGREGPAQKAMDEFKMMDGSPALYYAQAAWAFQHGNSDQGNTWVANAGNLFSKELNRSFAFPLTDLGWLKSPGAARQPATTPAAVAQKPTTQPSATPAVAAQKPTGQPSATPTVVAQKPAAQPSATPVVVVQKPTAQPSATPAVVAQKPTAQPSATPTVVAQKPTAQPSASPAVVAQKPPAQPSATPAVVVQKPTAQPSATPAVVAQKPTAQPSATPTVVVQKPTAQPSATPAVVAQKPTAQPSATPTVVAQKPTGQPSATPAVVAQKPASQPSATPPVVAQKPAARPSATPAVVVQKRTPQPSATLAAVVQKPIAKPSATPAVLAQKPTATPAAVALASPPKTSATAAPTSAPKMRPPSALPREMPSPGAAELVAGQEIPVRFRAKAELSPGLSKVTNAAAKPASAATPVPKTEPAVAQSTPARQQNDIQASPPRPKIEPTVSAPERQANADLPVEKAPPTIVKKDPDPKPAAKPPVIAIEKEPEPGQPPEPTPDETERVASAPAKKPAARKRAQKPAETPAPVARQEDTASLSRELEGQRELTAAARAAAARRANSIARPFRGSSRPLQPPDEETQTRRRQLNKKVTRFLTYPFRKPKKESTPVPAESPSGPSR